MNYTSSLLAVFFGVLSYAQSRPENWDAVNQVVYESKLTLNNSSLMVSRYKSPTFNENALIFKTESDKCTTNDGLTILLVTGERLFFDKVKVVCDSKQNNKHSVSTTLILDASLYEKFSHTEISEFQLGDIRVPVTFKEKGESLKGLFQISNEY